MNETLTKLTDEVGKKISEAFSSQSFKEFVEQTKAATDTGTFEVIISTSDMDRQGESVNQNGWDLEYYKKNPVVLWGHDYYSLPIGVCDSIELVEGKLIAKGRFAPESANPFAQQVRRLYDLKIIRATSVGFIARETEGNSITKAELLEFSFVPVPANPHALSLSKSQAVNLDLAMIATKGLKLEIQKEKYAVEKKDVQTIGAILAELSNDIQDSLVAATRAIISIVQSEYGQMATGKAEIAELVKSNQSLKSIKQLFGDLEKSLEVIEGEESPDGGSPKERSGNLQKRDTENLNDFLATRDFVRTFVSSAQKILERMNNEARDHARSKRK